MQKTKIEWADSTWNPVSGCQHGCEYCYARRIAERFGDKDKQTGGCHVLKTPIFKTSEKGGKSPYPYGFDPTLHIYRLNDFKDKKKGKNIFVCSMADLFGRWVPDVWINAVFSACKEGPQHNYLFLTKNPARYLEIASEGWLPEECNFWFGTTVTSPGMPYPFFEGKPYHTFLSVEPLLEPMGELKDAEHKPEWIIVGAESGNRKDKVVPKAEWVYELVDACKTNGIPIFMKDSISPIIGEENMIREFPEGLRR